MDRNAEAMNGKTSSLRRAFSVCLGCKRVAVFQPPVVVASSSPLLLIRSTPQHVSRQPLRAVHWPWQCSGCALRAGRTTQCTAVMPPALRKRSEFRGGQGEATTMQQPQEASHEDSNCNPSKPKTKATPRPFGATARLKRCTQIHAQPVSGAGILVHCVAGISRSAAIAK